jgi:citrate lyase subunit gamma (acyl carrier protein)
MKIFQGRQMEITQTSVAGTMESSDVMVTVEPGSKGIEIELESIVEKQFGREIRRAITETLRELGVKHAKVKAVDKGALDCTIRARVKTAVFRSGSSKAAPEWKV